MSQYTLASFHYFFFFVYHRYISGREVSLPLSKRSTVVAYSLMFLQNSRSKNEQLSNTTSPFSPREASPRLLRNVTLMHLSHVIDHFIFPRETILSSPMASNNLTIDHLHDLTAVRVGDVAFHVCFAGADVAAVREKTGHFGAGIRGQIRLSKRNSHGEAGLR